MMMVDSPINNKKAQISVFIIIGVVILFGALIYFMFLRGRGELAGEEEQAANVPLEVKPIHDFVDSCVVKVATEAIKLEGQHGGYVDVTDREYSERDFKLDYSDPSSSDGVPITEDSSSGVVYWWYLKTSNTCSDCIISSENIPSLESLERQVDVYVKRNLRSCLDGFRSFESAGFTVAEAGELKVDTVITEVDVVVNVDFPLSATLMERNTSMQKFVSHVPINLKKIYLMAKNIALSASNDDFLEYVTKSWIGINGGLHTNQLPPFYAIEESYSPKIWVEEVVRLNLQSLLTSYVAMLQLNDTKGAAVLDVGSNNLEKGLYRSFFLNVLNESYPDYSVKFLYLGWPIYLHISPSENGVLKAARVSDIEMMIPQLPPFITLVPQREYEFFYDLSYPVVVEIKNSDDLFGDGFTWLIALEVNLRDNRGLDEWFRGNGTYGEWDYSWMKFNPPTEEMMMVDGGEQLSLVRQNYTKDLFCSAKQRLSGNISVTVKDAFNESLIEGASIKYSCGKYSSCFIGRTTLDLDTGEVSIVDRFPICIGGGVMTIEKEGYKTEAFADISTVLNESADFEFGLVPIAIKNVSIEAIPLERVILYREPLKDYGNNYTRFLQSTGGTVPIDFNKESLIITVRKIDEKGISYFLPQNLIIDNSSSGSNTLKLIPGTYEVQTTYVDSTGYTIPPEKRCQEEEDCAFIPEEPGTVLTQTIGGGLTLNNVTGYWVVDKSDIDSGDLVKFKVLKLPPPVVIEDANEMSYMENLTGQYRAQLQPRFV